MAADVHVSKQIVHEASLRAPKAGRKREPKALLPPTISASLHRKVRQGCGLSNLGNTCNLDVVFHFIGVCHPLPDAIEQSNFRRFCH